ncbi:MAG: AAA family ATPase, partial [Victivallales bacterium]|nr:AAA family ATPase [Victivallales bacterium]
INVTLLELLKQMFRLTVDGLDPLPTDESGIDVAAILNTFREAIKVMDGWEVLDIVKIGQFSFGKFIMWNDMTARANELRQNKIVDHLVKGGGLFDDGVEVFPVSDIYKHLDLMNLYCPMNADSSQMAAVLYSALGKSFVLHGPPGTGKSQTITNIIAHNLAIGRRVLFVSEKKAALDVVHRRLTKVGLKPFCLELHSNKAGKKEVLEQFAEALQVAEQKPSNAWDQLVAELTKVRNGLNDYVQQLHKPYPNGLSAYQCFMQQVDRGKAQDGLLQINTLTQTKEDYDAMRKAVTELVIAFDETTDDSRKALDVLAAKEWNPLMQNELESACRKLLESVKTLRTAFDGVAEPLAIPEKCFETNEAIMNVMELTKLLTSSPDIPASFLTAEFGKQMDFIVNFANNTIKLNESAAQLTAFNLDNVGQLDVEGLQKRIHENNKKFFIGKYFANKKLLKELAGIKRLGSTELTIAELIKNLPLFEEYLKYKKLVDEQTPAGAALLGSLWQDTKTDWDRVSTTLDATHGILVTMDKLCGDEETARVAMLNALANYLPTATVSFKADTAIYQSFKALEDAWAAFRETAKQTAANFEEPADLNYPKSLMDKLEVALGQMSELRHVVLWKLRRQTVENYGLSGLVTALTDYSLNPEDAAEAVDTAYYRDMLYQILAESPALSHFSCKSHEEMIHQFCELDEKYMDLTKKIVFSKLSER